MSKFGARSPPENYFLQELEILQAEAPAKLAKNEPPSDSLKMDRLRRNVRTLCSETKKRDLFRLKTEGESPKFRPTADWNYVRPKIGLLGHREN